MHVYVYVILIITERCFAAQVRFTSFYNMVALLIHSCQGFYSVFSPLYKIYINIYMFHFVAMLANSNCVVQLKNPVLMLSNLHSEWEEINTFICQ